MKNKILLIAVVVLFLIYLSIRSFEDKTPFNNTVLIKDSNTEEILNLDMENYLIGVIAGEMPASFDEEALKAQAIASRTYAYYKIQTTNDSYDLTTDKSTQVYLNYEQMQAKWEDDYDFYYNKIKNAVNETENLVMTYDQKIIAAYYFAMSNGYTEDASLVFGEDKAYLKSVISKEDTTHRNYQVTQIISKEEFCQKLNANCDNLNIKILDRSKTNRINSLSVNDVIYKGTEFRKILDLRSTDFEITIEDDVLITTYGYGHGVGMSQYGANNMAKEGYKYNEILKHFYQGVEIVNITSII